MVQKIVVWKIERSDWGIQNRTHHGPGKNGRIYDQTHITSFFSYQEHFLKVSSKSDEPNSRYIENGIFWDQIWPNLGLNEGHARQKWANMWPNSSVFIHSIPIPFPKSFIKIWWTKFEIYWKRYILGPNMAQFGTYWWACPGKNGQTCDQTHQSSFFSYQEHFLKVSSKSHEPKSRYVGKRWLWTLLAQLPHPLLPILP